MKLKKLYDLIIAEGLSADPRPRATIDETLERRKQQLAAEGLFAPELKRRLPLLPRRIGLITGVNAQAMHDVVTNARHRWPATSPSTSSTPPPTAASTSTR